MSDILQFCWPAVLGKPGGAASAQWPEPKHQLPPFRGNRGSQLPTPHPPAHSLPPAAAKARYSAARPARPPASVPSTRWKDLRMPPPMVGSRVTITEMMTQLLKQSRPGAWAQANTFCQQQGRRLRAATASRTINTARVASQHEAQLLAPALPVSACTRSCPQAGSTHVPFAPQCDQSGSTTAKRQATATASAACGGWAHAHQRLRKLGQGIHVGGRNPQRPPQSAAGTCTDGRLSEQGQGPQPHWLNHFETKPNGVPPARCSSPAAPAGPGRQ